MAKSRTEGQLSQWLSGIGKAVDQVPGGSLLLRGARVAEHNALELLRDRLRRVDGGAPALAARRDEARAESAAAAAPTLQQLLDAALEQNRADALRVLSSQILAQLTPDEARLLSAMADGASYPLIHVMSAPLVGGSARRLVENVSNIGKKAGVQLQDRVRYYVAHLRALELAETGPEDAKAGTDYQLLETDTLVREVLEHVEKKGGGMKTRIVRRTLRMTAFGHEFWNACQAGPA